MQNLLICSRDITGASKFKVGLDIAYMYSKFDHCSFSRSHGCQNVSKSGTARVEKRAQHALRWGLGRECPPPQPTMGSGGAS